MTEEVQTVEQFVAWATPILKSSIRDWSNTAIMAHDHNTGVRSIFMDVMRYDTMKEVPSNVQAKLQKLQPLIQTLVECYMTGEGSSLTNDKLKQNPEIVEEWRTTMGKMQQIYPMSSQQIQAAAAAQICYKYGVEQSDFFATVCPSEKVFGSLQNVLTFCENSKFQAPTDIARMATVCEVLIKWIHPFHDGNGRCARAFALAYIDRNGSNLQRKDRRVVKSIDLILTPHMEALGNGNLTVDLCQKILNDLPESDSYFEQVFQVRHFIN